MLKAQIKELDIKGYNTVLLIQGVHSHAELNSFADEVDALWPDKRILFVFDPHARASIEQTDEATMNAHGWYRKENTDE